MFFHTRDGVVKAVNGVSYRLDSGRTLGIVGESGSGKSVTALTLMGLIPMPPGKIESGGATFRGTDLFALSERDMQHIRGNDIAMIFQDPMTSLNPVYKIGHQLAEPLQLHMGMSRRDAHARAVELLQQVGIPEAARRVKDYPHQLSGGMRQRVMIAMALACDPAILIADEPTTALDVTIQAQILELMQSVQARTNSAIIMITHDLGVIADMADDVLVMYAGRPVEYGSVAALFARPLHPYTWGLMDSLPHTTVDTDTKTPLTPIEGTPPSLIDLPAGCPFHPRCRYARELCRREVPALTALEAGHSAACHFAGDADFVAGRTKRATTDAGTIAQAAVQIAAQAAEEMGESDV
ncbi:MAG: ABC transporter ATP-binding protein [Actinomycetes bacterium]|nr:ABC transporter ATP-binding protein [Actinomycetes bacterium]